jgi:hypothetical protein
MIVFQKDTVMPVWTIDSQRYRSYEHRNDSGIND